MTDQTSNSSGNTPPPNAPKRRAEHFVNREAWDPYVAERLTAEQEKYYMAGQWKLMW
jgi:peptide/nickel transport system permease protein